MWDWVTSTIGDQMITLEELKMLEKPETSVKTKDPKTGKEGYRIGLEVFHQLHCLNLVRKSTHREYYEGKGDFAKEKEGTIREHIGEQASSYFSRYLADSLKIIVLRCYV